MDKLKMQSVNLTDANIDKIAALFPNCITETADENGKLKKAVNFDMLKAMLSEDIAEGDEAYEFTWVGKKAAIAEANRPIRKTLRPCVEESVNWDTTENLYIEGDNLEVLKLLQESYLGKVKMIYIDPPYNTGNDFIYRDDFKQTAEEYAEESGQLDEDGNRLFKNTDSNGRFHSDWCSMIYSRLMLARNLLSDDGVIFISIDDNEVHNLRKIADEVFGGNNFIANLIWEKRYTRNNDAKLMCTVTDHILLFRKSEALQKLREPRTEKQNSIYSNPDNDPRGVWTSVLFTSQRTKEERPNLSYPITNPYTNEEIVHPTNAWKYSKSQYEQLLKDNRLYWGKNGTNSYPRLKRFLSELDEGIVPVNLWSYKDTATLDEATKCVDSFLGKDVFDYPKPYQIIIKMLNLISDKDALILDFFSGSATTAHAVMQLNAEDGGHRKFIMVQLPEETDEKSEAYKAGYKNICEIGKERIRRAGSKIKEALESGDLGKINKALYPKAEDTPKEAPNIVAGIATPIDEEEEYRKTRAKQELYLKNSKNLDIGFRVLKLADSNMTDVYYTPAETDQQMLLGFESNIKPDRTDLDLLFGCLLDWGLPLSMPYKSEQIDGVTVHTYNDGDLIACFDKDISENVVREIAKREPLRVVFRDDSFADSPAKINVEEIFKLLSPDTRVKVI